jgi:SWI/SNF-related matrix-associated actin-dependent regulator 1 of chromatin subfamily A
MIKIKDSNTVSFYKEYWSDNEVFLANCLNIESFEGSMEADIRVVNKESLYAFMKNCFPSFLYAKEKKSQRDIVFQQIKNMYRISATNFLDDYYSKLNYPHDLFRHQKEALFEMANRRCTLLSFEQGLGKTITSASLSKMLGVSRTIIVCPSLVKWNWFRNMTEDWGFSPLYWTIYDRRQAQTINAFRERFVVINYEMVEKFFTELTRGECGHIIVDECHYVKNPSTRRSKALRKLISHYPDARVTLLSGTPITNRINDLFGYLKVCGHPLGKNYKKFKERYCKMASARGGERVAGSKNVPELRDRLKNFMIRKKTEECVDLPDLIINKYYIDTEDVKQKYNEELEKFYDNKITFDKVNDATEKARIKTKMNANLHTLNKITATAKVDAIAELVDRLWEEGKKAIVFSGYKLPLAMLEERYGNRCVKIDGSVSAHKRDALITKFKDDDKCHLFLGNFKAAGVGINLVNANHVIFMNFPFTPDDLEQPYKRAHRIGQTEVVQTYYTIGRDTIDENIFDIIQNKTEDINNLIDNEKKGVVHYDSIPNKLFRDLFKKRGLITEENKFEKV